MENALNTATTSDTGPITTPQQGKRPAILLKIAVPLFLFVFLMASIMLANLASPITQPIDDAWRKIVGQSPDSSFYLSPLPMFFQHLGEAIGALAILVSAILYIAAGRWRTGLFIVVTFLGCVGAFSQFFKHLVSRERPATNEALDLWGPLFHTDHGSFPSGHSVTAGAVAIILLALIPPTWTWAKKAWPLLALFLTLGMMWQRTLINAHWLSDTLSGVCLGIAGALLFWWLFYPGIQADKTRKIWFLPQR